MLTNAQLAAGEASIYVQLAAGTMTEAAAATALEGLYDDWNQQLSIGGLAKRLAEQVSRFDAKFASVLDLTWKGTLALVASLPLDGDEGDTWWVSEAALPDHPDGQAYTQIGAAWVPQGHSVTKGQPGIGVPFGGATGEVLTKVSGADGDTHWSAPGGAAWGGITGSLAAQTDLQAALTAKLAASVLDADGTLAANSDGRVATQKATKTYVDSLLAANDAMVFKGVINASANPNYPAASAGHTYRISVAGKVGGASGVAVEIGDFAICLVDGTSAGNQATVGANWAVIQANLDGSLALLIPAAPTYRPTAQRYHYPQTLVGGGSTTALAADTLYALPFFKPKMSMDALVLEVITPGTATLCQIGIYTQSDDGRTWTLLEQAAALDVTAAAVVVGALAAGRTVNDGFWVVCLLNGTCNVRPGVVFAGGAFAVMGASNLSGAAAPVGFTKAQTYNATLPSSFTGTVTPINTGPLMVVRSN